MGSAAPPAVPVEISSDEEDGERMPAAAGKRKSPEGALDWAEKMLAEEDLGAGGEDSDDPTAMQEFLNSLMDASGIAMGDKESAVDDKSTVRDAHGGDDDDDDDCIILDGDPDKPVPVAKEEGPRRDSAEDELQIVAEKGEVACRDFPHPRHLCAALPFSTSSHARHCSMCHCYVCDSPAPCAFWGKGTTHTDHCHATDKDAKWKILRQSSKKNSQPTLKRRSIQNFYQSSATGPSSQPSVNMNSSTGRLPVSSGVGQNQQVNPSIVAPWNTVQGISMLRVPSPLPRATTPSFGSQSARVAPAVYKPSNVNRLQASVPSYVPMQPGQPRAFQLAQVPPRGRINAGIFQSNHTQFRPGAPIGSQGHQYRTPSYPQLSPNIVVGTGVPLSRCTSVATQGTEYPQVPSADTGLKEALANLARELGVPDYNTNQPLDQQSESTNQSLNPSRVPAQVAQAKASQRVQVNKAYVAATSQMRPSNGRNSSNNASAGTVLSSGPIQMRQPLCQMNSESSVIPSGTAPSTLLDRK